mgnify:CR=1 FL=1
MEIIPAIIPKSFEELEDRLSDVRGLVPCVQVDVCDGSLTLVRTWPYQKAGKSDMDFKEVISERKAFPFWEDVEFEAHLMVKEPERIISDWVSAGASRIIVQIEGTEHFEKCVEAVAGRVPLGVSITLDTSLEVLKSLVKEVSVIQCMGWNFSHLGRQGVLLNEEVFARISQLRESYPDVIISVDGGVTIENAPKLLSAGAKRLVVGSALWNNASVQENLALFKNSTQ